VSTEHLNWRHRLRAFARWCEKKRGRSCAILQHPIGVVLPMILNPSVRVRRRDGRVLLQVR